MKRFHLLLLVTLIGSVAFFRPQNTQIRLYVIGDSTASPYDAGSYPRTGWAQVLQAFFNQDSVTVLDKARSGRSSKSYYNESAGWPAVKSQMQAGDYLFIQFGHNDSKSDTARFTDPFTTYQEYLMRYIDECRALGGHPVLMTSIHRNNWQSDTLTIKDTHGDYLLAARQLADSADVPLIDLADLTKELYESFGYSRCTEEIFMNLPANVYPAYLSGNDDNTHLQEEGAYEVANLVAEAIAASSDSLLMALQPGLMPMQRVYPEVSPALSGYIKGPRYFPVNTTKGLLALAAPGFKFKRWSVNGNEVSTQALYSFSVEQADSDARVAEFVPESDGLEDLVPGLMVYPSPAADWMVVDTPVPVSACVLVNLQGQQIREWKPQMPVKQLELELTDLPDGHYHLGVQVGNQTGWTFIRVIH